MKPLFGGLGSWLDARTGYRRLVRESLYENVPGGSSWAYIFGSMLVFAFVTQVITGVFLWMAYSPGSQNAWESVYYIQNEMQGGWLLRGVHHYMSQAMIVLLALHMLQVVLFRAYVKPREVNFWLGLILMLLTLALGLTGYLLPWDQKGYWATKVATELSSLAPGGTYLQQLMVGGSEYGHFTLTRFFAMHAGVLPALFVLVLVFHIALFRRHGVTALSARRPDEYFWPGQIFKDALGCFVLLLVVLGLTIVNRGAELGPPAEPTEAYGAARPEWYYLFLFQLLKKFDNEFVGAIVIPSLVMLFLFAMPLVARIKFGHIVNVVVVLILLISIGYLTGEAIWHDRYARYEHEMPEDRTERLLHLERKQISEEFLLAEELAHREYERVRDLIAHYGIPPEGAAASIVRNDPEIQGPRLFVQHCASCHSYLDEHGRGIPGPRPPRDEDGLLIEDPEPYGAPNLYGFGSRQWLEKLLDPTEITSDDMFGLTAHAHGEMVMFVQDELDELDEDQQTMLDQIIAALSAEAELLYQREADAQAREDGTIEAGIEAMSQPITAQACTDCHKFHDEGYLGFYPDLTNFASYDWLYQFISNPEDERFYPDTNDRMPAFAPHEDPHRNQLSPHEIDMLVRWLRGDDRDLELAMAMRKEPVVPEAVPEEADQEEMPTDPAEPEPEQPEPVEPEPEEPEPAEPERQLTEAARLFQTRCARCHSYVDGEGQGFAGPEPREDAPNGAANLYGFASRDWLTGFMDPERITDNDFFGNTAHRDGEMVDYVELMLADLTEQEQEELELAIIALSAEAQLPQQAEADQQAEEDSVLEEGRQALLDWGCWDCHKFHDDGFLGLAPDLTGYGSTEWLIEFIRDPEHERFYPDTNDRMPAFGELLSDEQLESLARFIRGEEPLYQPENEDQAGDDN